MKYSDRMDSFVLAETFKYFYLLFSDPKELPIDIDRYVFTTQAHILPIGLPRTHSPVLTQTARLSAEELSISLKGLCPAPDKNASRAITLRRLLMPQLLTSTCPVVKRYDHLEEIRQPLRNKLRAMKELKVEPTELPPVTLSAATLNVNDVTHLQMLRRMGIMVTVGGSGEIQLKLNRTEASSAVLGITVFIHFVNVEVIHTQTIALIDPPHFGRTRFEAGPSMFTYYPGENSPPPNTSSSSAALVNSSDDWEPVVGPLVIAEPFDACSPVYADGFLMANDQLHSDLVDSPPPEKEGELPKQLLKDAIVLVQRGGCMFMDKAKNIKRVGARGVIVIDNKPSSTSARDKFFYMSGDSPDGKPPEEHLQLPFVFLYHEEGQTLTNAMERRWMSEKKPVVVMIAKREDSPSMGIEFSILLDRLLKMINSVSKQRGEAKKSEQCYELSTGVEEVQSTCFLKKRIRVDGIHEEDADGWSMTLGPIENTHAFLSIDPSSGKVFPTNPAAWIDFLDRNWPTKNYDKNCKDLVLAVSEAALSQITEVDEVKGRQSMTKLTQTWRDRLSNCLQGLTTPETTNAESNECQKPYLQLTLNLAANNSC
ncbi:unnamed protein product [Hymenolepis diminuta]|uniref:PA domain-containing protein n=1 Tax=Hymenolepis diminuta TaxID=6216 RepID=A0A158QDX0_HYMDI|nr:unnamed protein product [Hymenolepis diminuta]